MSYDNLMRMFKQADAVDYREGLLAYPRYQELLAKIGQRYGFGLEPTVAAFAALSPNNDYFGNLRSLVSVLDGINKGMRPGEPTISTYGHCGVRAYRYATGEVKFLGMVRGLKIRAFYSNILDPSDKQHVTIDGHMVATYRGNNGTMKANIVRPKDYAIVARSLKRLARNVGLIPNQAQAIIWFTRKRVLKIKYEAQLNIFAQVDNQWGTLIDLDEIKPYPLLTRGQTFDTKDHQTKGTSNAHRTQEPYEPRSLLQDFEVDQHGRSA